MPKPDLVLLHAPSVHDFRMTSAMYGPISDVIPSTPVFEMYPLGFLSIVGYLERHGYVVRIVNLAVKMLADPNLDVERLIQGLNPKAFGVDLHWLVHAQGSLEICRILKKLHPEAPVIMGGLSATYYQHEIISRYPQVDYVLRGDSVEMPILQLLKSIEDDTEPLSIPNLTWRDKDGRRHENPLSYVPDDLDEFSLDYTDMVRLVVRHRDMTGNLPYQSWLEYPFSALITCKGCLHDCVTCGGSRTAFRRFFCREKPAFKSPDKLVSEMKVIEDYIDGPIFLIGDLRQGGQKYATAILERIKKEKVKNTITFELFHPASDDYLKQISDSCESYTMEISPDTHDDTVRRLLGRHYTILGLERTIDRALERGCERMDVFFMTGLPSQNMESVKKTIEYSRRLLDKFGKGRVHPFIAPLAPFLDPGSIAFENPAKYGYTRLYATLEEHKNALLEASWKYYLNYETAYMSRDQIAESTYAAVYDMNKLKCEKGLIDEEKGRKVLDGIAQAVMVMNKIDMIYHDTKDRLERGNRLATIKEELQAANYYTLLGKENLRVTHKARIRRQAPLRFLMNRFKNPTKKGY